MSNSDHNQHRLFVFQSHLKTEKHHHYLIDCLHKATEVPLSISDIQRIPGQKPKIRGHPEFDFSLSHSGDHIAVLVGQHQLVGIDIEDTTKKREFQKIAKRYFSTDESDFLDDLVEKSHQKKFFLKLWTRKEALGKCLGTGIRHGLLSTSVLRSPVFEKKHQKELHLQTWETKEILISFCFEKANSSLIFL